MVSDKSELGHPEGFGLNELRKIGSYKLYGPVSLNAIYWPSGADWNLITIPDFICTGFVYDPSFICNVIILKPSDLSVFILHVDHIFVVGFCLIQGFVSVQVLLVRLLLSSSFASLIIREIPMRVIVAFVSS